MSKMSQLAGKIIGAHNVSCVAEIYKSIQDHSMKSSLYQNIKFKNIHNGKRCFIFGNGPSLKVLDFRLFKDEITFTVNQLARNPNFQLLHTNYHMWSDTIFFDINPDRQEDLELLTSMKSVKGKDNALTVFYRYDAKKMVEKNELQKELDIHYFEQGWYDISPKRDVDFCHFVPAFSTVVHYAICLAVYMGFNEIYLLGCDCSGFLNIAASRSSDINGQASYGYNISENEKKRMERVSSVRHVRDELYGYVRLFDDYKKIYDYCSRRHVKLLNATYNSLLDCIPKVNLDEVLQTQLIDK